MALGVGVTATGGIPRVQPFEPPVPNRPWKAGLFIERDGELNDGVKGDGIVVLTACGYSGIVDTVRCAQELTGVDKVAAVIGGFHLGLPGVPKDNLAPTIAALTETAPSSVAPMHCSGFHAQKELWTALPDPYVQNLVGTTISFGS